MLESIREIVENKINWYGTDMSREGEKLTHWDSNKNVPQELNIKGQPRN